MLAVFQYCEDEPFVVERGEVKTPDGKVLNYPTLQYRKEVVEKDKVNSLVGKQDSYIFLRFVNSQFDALMA